MLFRMIRKIKVSSDWFGCVLMTGQDHEIQNCHIIFHEAWVTAKHRFHTIKKQKGK